MTPDNKFTIRIESILGGHSPTTHFGTPDQFRASLGIDPALPITDQTNAIATLGSGLLRPMAVSSDGTTVAQVNWLIANPKSVTTYVYDAAGSVYTLSATGVLAGLGDLNDGGTSYGDGAEYYDNYIYFARSTTIARYGPLDGTPAFTDDYWAGTLSKTALHDAYSEFRYPSPYNAGDHYPAHVLHRHSDGKMYIADTVGNQGTIHFIQTSKSSVEGDTDNGSTYNKVQVGYGLYPTAMESYGSDLAIAFIETNTNVSTNNVNQMRGKIAFWDTVSTNINKLVWVEFPDAIITGLKNINGTLYVVSGPRTAPGYRISRFVGGYTFEEIYYSETGNPPYPGAIDGTANRLLFGSSTQVPEFAACVWSFGLQNGKLGRGLFNTIRTTAGSSTPIVTALLLRSNFGQNGGYGNHVPTVASYPTSGTAAGTIDDFNLTYSNTPSVWWSQMFRIGQPFKITKIRIPLGQAITANMTVTPKIYTDDGAGTTYTLAAINNTNDSGKFNVVRRSGSAGEVMTGQHNFWVELRWTGSALCTVGLPITIEGEYVDD